MKNVSITFDPNAEAGQAAMADNRPYVKSWPSTPKTSRRSTCTNVKIEGYEGERLHFANVGHLRRTEP